MMGPALSMLYVVAAAQSAAPASAAWAQLDVGIGLPSIVIICIFVGACAAVLRDRLTHSGTLFGTFFTALITTIACVHFVLRPVIPDAASQAVAGMFLAYNAQRWAGKFTERLMRGVNSQESRRKADD